MLVKVILALTPLLGTILGAVLGISKLSNRTQQQDHILVGIATGILGVICIDLLFEASEYSRNIFLVIGIFMGLVFITMIDKLTHHEETHLKLFWAMLIHNIPEGIIIGISLANCTNIKSNQIGIVLGITIQNIPDGLVVSMSTLSRSKQKKKSAILGIISGIVEPIAALIIVMFTQNNTIDFIEPLFLGFSVVAIFAIELDLIKELLKSKKFNFKILDKHKGRNE